MSGRWIRRRASVGAAVAVGILVGGTVLNDTAYAPPQGAAPVNIADAQEPNNTADVSADGALEVEGNVTLSGTSQVEVVNTPLSVTGEVDVGNFPSVQEVNVTDAQIPTSPAVATSFQNVSFDLNAQQASFFPIAQMDLSFILISRVDDDEVIISFFDNSQPLLSAGGDDWGMASQSFSLPLAVPVDQLHINCGNEPIEGDCEGNVWLVGS